MSQNYTIKLSWYRSLTIGLFCFTFIAISITAIFVYKIYLLSIALGVSFATNLFATYIVLYSVKKMRTEFRGLKFRSNKL